ncbi:TRAP transporter small permease [Acuticoccus mangrovi]|uniref:TRAP transporter small permease protein n=1 Tax=Acuticoccus mangrovi TaxID=2796142 RepID=A0A934IMM8_9HYPH|nr:TRAP transporter small permease [Acuticoccus mangrovi]MBJ3775027.1 TRAP transporter small permease [Acuticoccus mangrovi]
MSPSDAPPRNLFLRVIAAVSFVCGIVAALMILTAVAITCQLIFVRFVLNDSTIWQTEVVTYLMISATMLGLPYVQHLRGHVNVDLLPMMLPPTARRVLGAITLLATAAVAAIMTWYGYELFHFAFERNWKSDTVWGAPLWVPYAAIPIGFGLYLVQLAADLVYLPEEVPAAHTSDPGYAD